MSNPYIDLHSDTISMLHYPFENLQKNSKMVSIPSLQKGGARIQCFSAFVPTGYFPRPVRYPLSFRRFMQIAEKKERLLSLHKEELFPIHHFNDITTCIQENKIGLLFTLEDSGVFGTNPSRVEQAYNKGIRIASLTWNHENHLGFPNSTNASIMNRGLKPFGFLALEEMERLGIIPDVSHLSDGGFFDVASHCKKPFIATHSNCRAVTNHPRNLTDDMIRSIGNQGGVIGLNFCPKFLCSPNPQEESRIEYMVQHVLHMRNTGGTEVLAIGSDFDGIKGRLEISEPSRMPLLFHALEKAGMSASEIDKLCFQNAKRVLQDCLL